jgi:hypothetical protein
MKSYPSIAFDAEIEQAVRNLRVWVHIDQSISHLVKNIRIVRDAGDSKLASFTSALATDADITLAGCTADLGQNALGKSISIVLGSSILNQGIYLMRGYIRNIKRDRLSDETVLNVQDTGMILGRQSVNTPAMFNVNSAVFIREILENCGISCRVGTPSQMVMALEFDSNTTESLASIQRDAANTDNNGINQMLVKPNPWFDLDNKPYYFEEGTFSQRLVVQPFTISRPDSETIINPNSTAVDPRYVMQADNAGSRLFVPTPPGYGGGQIKDPSILHFSGGLWGWHYWAAVTPYPYGDFEKGDPIIVVSDDGATFSTNPNFTNPMASRPVTTAPSYARKWVPKRKANKKKKIKARKGYWSVTTIPAGAVIPGHYNQDASLCYDGTLGRLYVLWRLVQGNVESIRCRYTSNGTDWSSVEVWDSNLPKDSKTSFKCLMGPDGIFHQWWVDRRANPNVMYHSTSVTVGGSRSATETCDVEIPAILSTMDIYSISAINDPAYGINAAIVFCQRNTDGVGSRIHLGVSTDGRNWAISRLSLITASRTGWDNSAVYDACLIENFDSNTGQLYTMYYTAFDGNGRRGMGVTSVFQDAPALEASVPSKVPNGPVYYGPARITRHIDGITPCDRTTLWANSEEPESHYVSFGGFFSFIDEIDWASTTNQCLLMEVYFGSNHAFRLYKFRREIVCEYHYLDNGAWATRTGNSIWPEGIWAAGEEHFIGIQIETTWETPNRRVAMSGIVDAVASYENDSSANSTNTTLDTLSGWSIVDSMSRVFHDNRIDSSFPGMTYDSLFVSATPLPTTPPIASYRLERGLNTIIAASYQGTDPWSELKDITEAEMGCLVIDETGVVRFYNRHHYLTPEATAIRKTITENDSLMGVSVVERLEDIRNVVHVKVKSQDLGVTRDVWNLSSPMWVNAEETKTFLITVPGVLESLDIVASPTASYGSTRYRAQFFSNMDSNGTPMLSKNEEKGSVGGAEEYLHITLIPYGEAILVTITNDSMRPIALADGDGDFYFYIWGRTYRAVRYTANDGVVITESDEASIARFGSCEYEVSLNYLTNETSGRALAQYLLARYRNGIQRLEGIDIVGDPRLDVGDRITIQEHVMGIDGHYWIEKLSDDISPDVGYRQSLAVSLTDDGQWFMLDHSTLDGTDGLAY